MSHATVSNKQQSEEILLTKIKSEPVSFSKLKTKNNTGSERSDSDKSTTSIKKYKNIYLEDISDDDELYLVQCPKDLDISLFSKQKVNLSGVTKINLKSNNTIEAYSEKLSNKRLINLLLPSKITGEVQLGSFNISGSIVITDSIEIPIIKQEIVERKKIPLPEILKKRHPTLGTDYNKVENMVKPQLTPKQLRKIEKEKLKNSKKIIANASKKRYEFIDLTTNAESNITKNKTNSNFEFADKLALKFDNFDEIKRKKKFKEEGTEKNSYDLTSTTDLIKIEVETSDSDNYKQATKKNKRTQNHRVNNDRIFSASSETEFNNVTKRKKIKLESIPID